MQEYNLQTDNSGQSSLNDYIIEEGLVDAIIFRNSINGFTVLAVDADPAFIAVGTMPELEEGDSARFHGHWSEHPEFGQQLKVAFYEPVLPRSVEGIRAYLSSGIIKGVGPKTAELLVRAFAEKTLDVLTESPEKASKIKGISLRHAKEISSQLLQKREYQDLVMLLSPLGVGPGRILRIFRKWGSSAAGRIVASPYSLADEFSGIGFLTADKLALGLGVKADDSSRIESAVLYWLGQALNAGNTWYQESVITKAVGRLLGLDEDLLIRQALERLIGSKRLICFQETAQIDKGSEMAYALPEIYEAEQRIAKMIKRLAADIPTRFPDWRDKQYIRNLISEAADCNDSSCRDSNSTEEQLKLSPEQTAALEVIMSSQVCILTGGPGTGKTTMLKALCDCIKHEKGRLILAAPTGRAARRLSEATGLEAKTLHRLLSLQLTDRHGVEQALSTRSKEKIYTDFLIVDESSMLDMFLFERLLEAIPAGTRLLLTGDIDQLPSIGPGQVLKDLLNSRCVPAVRLTKIFRQAGQSLIVRNAHRIKAGQWFEVDQSFDSSFIWVAKNTQADIAEAVGKLCASILPEQYKINPVKDTQVLTPIRKGAAGTVELNRMLQEMLNSTGNKQQEKKIIRAHGVEFAVGDKVIQMKNQYNLAWEIEVSCEKGLGVMNGETGLVTDIDPEDNRVSVLFDDERQVVYDQEALEDLELAYAVTIHKSQGSEYPVVVLALPSTAPALLNRHLLYTAVTRAKSRLFLVSSRNTLLRALQNDRENLRNTMLGYLLRDTDGPV